MLRVLLVLLAPFAAATAAQAACTTASTALTFAASSSYDVQAGTVTPVTGSAGLACTGAFVSVLGSNYARATITSANGFRLSAGGADTLPYQASADAAGRVVFTQGSTIDYMNGSLISLPGAGSSGNFTAPIFARLLSTANVAAGTYTDTLTVNWDYAVCSGLQVSLACAGYESGRVTTVVTITLVVGRDCRITAPDVSFGSAALVTQFAPVSRAVLVDCTKGSAYRVGFSNGQAGSARPWRVMSDGAGHGLQYNIYRPDGTTVWDESNPQPGAAAGTGSTTPSQMQNYVARVNPAQVTPPAGSYTDTVSVVVTF